MFKFILGIVCALLVYLVFFDTSADIEAKRVSAQQDILLDIEKIGLPGASRFVDEWRNANPSPSDEKITELKVIAARIKANPTSAIDFTAEEKKRKQEALPFEPIVGFSEPHPGVN